MAVRSIVYVDGFNLYYGALKRTSHKWLNLERYFDLLRQQDDIQLIHYFTALVDGAKQGDQQTYLQALDTLPKVNIVLGKYKKKQLTCGVQACAHAGSRDFIRPEEKQTDVNIALQMLDDAYQQLAERFVVVSGDSDLVPALNMVRMRFPTIQILVYIPARNPIRGAAVELRTAADKHRSLPLELLRRAQFPPVLTVAGATLSKPADW